MTKDEDLKQVQRCLSGHIQAFETLVDKYQKPIYNIVYRMCHDVEDTRDITQSIFIKAYQKLDTFNPKFRFFSWLYRIAINETLNYLEKNKRMEKIPINYAASEGNPEKSLERLEFSEKIQQGLLQIEAKYRALIILKHFQNLSYQQISQIVNLPEKTVKSRLYSARQQLGEALNKLGIH